MELWAVLFDTNTIEQQRAAYQQALLLLDTDSRTQVQRYYSYIDQFRGLLGRLLVRKLLRDHGVSLHAMTFAQTPTRKPYITTPDLTTLIGYNITHDSGAVAMAYCAGPDLHPYPPAHQVGVDIMRLQLPRRLSYADFVESVSDQLTVFEREMLHPAEPLELRARLRRFFLVWTLKEAYTKALGEGLGFDFKRIEYDVQRDTVRIDGAAPAGWQFVRFDLQRGDDAYVGVSARYTGAHVTGKPGLVEHRPAEGWIRVYDAPEFLQIAIQTLSS